MQINSTSPQNFVYDTNQRTPSRQLPRERGAGHCEISALLITSCYHVGVYGSTCTYDDGSDNGIGVVDLPLTANIQHVSIYVLIEIYTLIL